MNPPGRMLWGLVALVAITIIGAIGCWPTHLQMRKFSSEPAHSD